MIGWHGSSAPRVRGRFLTSLVSSWAHRRRDVARAADAPTPGGACISESRGRAQRLRRTGPAQFDVIDSTARRRR